MDCPTCGLVNPPEVLTCDCGYDFGIGKAAENPGWEIQLAWRQKLAAFWSISWPAWIGSMGVVALTTSGYPIDFLQENSFVLALGAHLAFFAIQALLTPRLVRKNFRSFHLYVLREDGSKGRKLSIRDALSVWQWIFVPQLAFFVLASLAVSFLETRVAPDAVRGFSSLALWLRVLLIGPYAIGLALRRKYPSFRLQANGFRHA